MVEEYVYHVDVRANEAFANAVRREGVNLPDVALGRIVFSHEGLLDMKSYKRRGLIWSYSIVRIVRNEEEIERG